MKGIITIIKIFAVLFVVAVIGVLVLFLNKFQDDFNDPKAVTRKPLEEIIEENEQINFEAGQYEFNRALELIALGDIEEAKEKLQSAIQTWEAALEESDMDDKKARINKKVVPDLYNNVILAAILVQDFDKADDHYSATLRLDFANRDESNLKELKLLNDDLRERHEK